MIHSQMFLKLKLTLKGAQGIAVVWSTFGIWAHMNQSVLIIRAGRIGNHQGKQT